MNLQRHERIAQIKKLSRYLYLALTGIQYLLCVGCLLTIIWLWAGTEGVVSLDRSMAIANVSFVQRCLITVIVSVFLSMLLRANYHLRQLVLLFAGGDIFNRKAISHARMTLRHALLIYGFYTATSLSMWGYLSITNQTFKVSLNGNYFFGLIVFGLMHILLWALEIGCDLNEESELTI